MTYAGVGGFLCYLLGNQIDLFPLRGSLSPECYINDLPGAFGLRDTSSLTSTPIQPFPCL